MTSHSRTFFSILPSRFHRHSLLQVSIAKRVGLVNCVTHGIRCCCLSVPYFGRLNHPGRRMMHAWSDRGENMPVRIESADRTDSESLSVDHMETKKTTRSEFRASNNA